MGGPPPCRESTISANFNGIPIAAGDSIWFNANIKASGIPASGATIIFRSTISSTHSDQTDPLFVDVPAGRIIFSPDATCATTSFSNENNNPMWTTIVPISGSNEIFLSGVALLLPEGLRGGVKPLIWRGEFRASDTRISVQWKWAAAVYTCFPPAPDVYNLLEVKPTHTNSCNVDNGDHAGTPENPAFKQCVTGGARGDGGSNFTGSWSATEVVQ